MPFSRHLAAGCSGLALALATPSQAQEVLRVDSFDYISSPAGNNGGAGWGGPWSGASFESLVAWWPMDGNARDAGPFGFHAKLSDGSFILDTPPGLVASTHSLSFTKNPNTLFDISNHVSKFGTMVRGSISMWLKVPTSSAPMAFFSAANSSGDNLQIWAQSPIGVSGTLGNYPHFRVKGSTPAGVTLAGVTNVSDGLWHHLAVTVDETQYARLYIDGYVEAAGPTGFFAHVVGVNGAWLGRARTTRFSKYMKGQIDDFAIWGNTLSQADILSLASSPPGVISGPPSIKGPAIASGSLDSPAFNTFGLTPAGDRVSERTGIVMFRQLQRVISLSSFGSTYMSFLIRRPATLTGGAEIHFSDSSVARCMFGWDSSFVSYAGIEKTTRGPLVQADTTYFVVIKIDSANSGPDQMFVRMYRPTEAVDAAAPATAWDIISTPEPMNETLRTMVINPTLGTSAIEIDEIRFGDTWESVTRVSYGTGCLGNAIGRSARPALNSSDYRVRLSGAEPNQAAFLTIGGNNVLWGSIPLPLDLSVVGAQGCSVLASRDLTIAGLTTDQAGATSVAIAIPNSPALVNRTLFAQWTTLAPSSPNTLKLAFSDAMEVLIER